MTISTYAELQTAVANWLDRSDLTARIPEFIALGEPRLSADFGALRQAWSNTTLTGTTSSRSVALPTGFVEPQSLFLTTYGGQTPLTPFVNGTMELRTSNGIPAGWSINGTNIELDCLCDQAHTFLFRYRGKFQLSNTATTNALLTDYPNVYLATALIEAFDFMSSPEGVARWEGKYNDAREEIEQVEARSLAVAPLRVDFGLLPRRPGAFNYSLGE